MNREDLARLDAADPLAPFRARFELPPGVIYLDGNSLGALPVATRTRMAEAIEREWGRDLIKSWNTAGWIDAPTRIGAKIARVIGAHPDEVVATDSTSVNLFKVLAAALGIQASQPGRRVIISEPDNFPTDLYMVEGLISQLQGRHELMLLAPGDIPAALGDDTAVLMLTHVNYRDGRMHDMAALTRLAQSRGALVVWDLAHSAGAVPVDLTAANADFAVGCGYKYLNGGPGAPAFLYVARRHQERFAQPLSGWHGHAQPFEFEAHYRPGAGVSRYLCGTPPMLSMIALEVGVDLMLEADMALIRDKSLAMSECFIRLVEERCAGHGLELVTPRDPAIRGSQASFTHAEGYPVMQALIARGVIGDFRAPGILRFGFTPLYLRYTDIWDAVEILREVLETRVWDAPEYRRRAAVT